ncbi:hypothetical protein HHI36_010926 [Cryptolaemus montrouzieri]|uniref:Glycerate kinase n=1 Tax=Cryptolaemus montrouzieri TaxID=559131 RepID=A0ABD2MK79_9CUCU
MKFFKTIRTKLIISTLKSALKMSNSNEILRELFRVSVDAVQPYKLIIDSVKLEKGHLTVKGVNYPLRKPVHIVGFGKAVLEMAIALEDILGSYLQMGIISIPQGILESCKISIPENSKIQCMEGANNNLPDQNSLKASLKIQELVENLNEDETIVVLISGGGSALLPLPKDGITLSEKLELIKKLGNSGADILELNCVRKEISKIKGGGLAKLCYPARVITLILSDVIEDRLDIIASGPTCTNMDTSEKAIDILKKYSLYENLAESIKKVLQDNSSSKEDHTFIRNGKFCHVDNYIIGNNRIAVDAILEKSKEFGFQSFLLSTNITGNVAELSKVYAGVSKNFADFLSNTKTKKKLIDDLLRFNKMITFLDEESIIQEVEKLYSNQKICLILAGEPTVIVTGSGLGGRNQQLALSFSVELHKLQIGSSVSVTLLSCGTDGIDGPTDAAGAIGYSTLVHDCVEQNLDPNFFLGNNDCYNFYNSFQGGKYLVKIGHTGTNVMDIHIILIEK